ncbi:uncharacterized protein LOC126370413 [Pectinophora gossypiella]|uniref:uncharacterized protein LOC126370413 n=1 Tax=Pectinophora gossypiella TaxID=13191 RepID=UPI00214EC145|nr:uncharacterized protein LOC126370413 [Pectinophora gossypiella]
MLRDNYMQPELTMSFVVIGTKIMFDTGYEQYLPIERVVTHQRFKGWTADLALVYTFAGMISDKPGQILKIASASNAPVDSNVTVLSWGKCKGDIEADEFRVTKSGTDSSSRENRHRKRKHRASIRGGVPDTRHYKDNRNRDLSGSYQSRFKLKNSEPIDRQSIRANDGRSNDGRVRKEESSTRISRYLGANEAEHNMRVTRNNPETSTTVIASLSEETKYSNDKYLFQTLFDEEKKLKAKLLPKKYIDKRVLRPHHRIRRMMPRAKYMDDLSHYKSWRRQSGSQHNNLTVGTFGYVNLAACKKIVERTLPPLYEIHNKNEVLCYASEEFYITNEDSGAPVVQKDQLVAVTVGGVDSNGEHVAVGMKISCFCSWIAANLPNGAGNKMKCCTNCCNNNKKERGQGKRDPVETPHTRLREQKRQIGVHRFVNEESEKSEEKTETDTVEDSYYYKK